VDLRPYQTQAIAGVYREMARGNRRVVLVAPTGSGKTVMAARIIRDAVVTRQRRCLFLAHRRELIFQCAAKLEKFGVPHGVILAGEHADNDTPCHVASIDTLHAGNAVIPSLAPGDLVVTDECHRANSLKLRGAWPDGVWHLGLTATPVRARGDIYVPLHGEYDAMVQASTPRDLVAVGAIVPARISAPILPDLESLKSGSTGDYIAASLAALMGDPTLISGLVAHLAALPPAKTVLFSCSVKHARDLAAALRAAGLNTMVAHGDMDDRDSAMRAFHDDSGSPIVCNADLLIEGWDADPDIIPGHQPLTRVVMARPTKSLPLFLQQIGRAVRPYPGKTECEVIDYAGNVIFHGDPYDSRPWTLDKADTKKRRASQPSAWRCATCFCLALGAPSADTCPYCGAAIKKAAQRLKYVNGKIVEYDADELAKLAVMRDKMLAEETEQKARNKDNRRELWAYAMRTRGGDIRANTGFVVSMLARYKQSGHTWEQFCVDHGIRQ
jgi:superfamily II DNA or RNA helicase